MIMKHIYIPAKLLISFVGRHKGESCVSVAKAAGARGGTIVFGRTVGDSKILQALFLADVSQDVVFTLMGREADAVVEALINSAREYPKKFGGFAVLLDVSGLSVRVPEDDARLSGNSDYAPESDDPKLGSDETTDKERRLQTVRSKSMESGYTLISVIVNAGYADDVMAAARKAGAKGGTILNARGTGTEEDVKFFGIILVPEKEMLMVVAENDKVRDIAAAVSAVPTLSEPGGGIVYTMNVEQFILLGQ